MKQKMFFDYGSFAACRMAFLHQTLLRESSVIELSFIKFRFRTNRSIIMSFTETQLSSRFVMFVRNVKTYDVKGK